MYSHYLFLKYAMSGQKGMGSKTHAHSFVEEEAFRRAMTRIAPFSARFTVRLV